MAMTRGLNNALDNLADWILNESTGDDLELLEILQGLISPLMFQALCLKLERCEVHICDVHICEDDEADCPAGAEAQQQRWQQEEALGHMLTGATIEELGD